MGKDSNRRELEALNFLVKLEIERNFNGMDKDPGRKGGNRHHMKQNISTVYHISS